MSLTPFEHLFLSGLFGDAEIAALLSTEAEIVAMLRFEAELAAAQAAVGVGPADTTGVIIAAIAGFTPDMAALRTATGKDGVVVPELVRQLRHAVGEPAAAKVHFGATSQDVIDTALMLRLKSIGQILGARLENCLSAFAGLEAAHGGRALTGFTRMQAAIPITVADRIRAWRDPLVRDCARLSMQEFAVQFGGAAGTLDALGDRGPTVRAELARRLDLAEIGVALGEGDMRPFGREIDRDRIHARHRRDGALDMGDAARAGHALDAQIKGFEVVPAPVDDRHRRLLHGDDRRYKVSHYGKVKVDCMTF